MERKKKRLATPLKRKIHVKGRVWTYKVGGWKVIILHPDRRRQWLVPSREFDSDDNYSLGPYEVKKWIEANLSKE